MKKSFKNLLFLALPILLMSVSCSSDDNSSTTNNNNNNGGNEPHVVEYKLTIEEPVLTALTYKNAEGNMVAASEALENLTAWSKKVETDNLFSPKMQIEFEAPAGSPVDYTMQIFIDGELVHSDNSFGIGTTDAELEYIIE